MSEQSFNECFVELEDLTLHYLEWGTPGSTPVLLLHGYLDIAHGWSLFAEQLKDDFHIIAPNFRGHGKSGWGDGYSYVFYNYIYDLAQLLEHLEWDTFVLVGHSMGANCASVFAGTFPERITHLMLLEGFGVPGFSADDAPERLAKHVKRRFPGSRKKNKVFATFEDVVERIKWNNPRYPEGHAELLAKHGAKQLEDGSWTWLFDPRMRLPNPVMYQMEHFEAFWKRIQAPTIQVIGKESNYAGFASPDHWNIPGMQIAEIDGAGHMIQHDAADALVTLFRSFLASGDDE